MPPFEETARQLPVPSKLGVGCGFVELVEVARKVGWTGEEAAG